MIEDIKDLIKGNYVNFLYLRSGVAYYSITHEISDELSRTWMFPVPLEDIGNATINSREKALTFMRWIRKANEDGTLVFYHDTRVTI